jgi:hypothetical protein
MPIHNAKGKTFVATENGEALSVRPLGGNSIMLSNGERVQVKRFWTTAAIATGASDTTVIAAPANAQTYLVILAYTVMCDAATLVTFRSNSTTIGMPLPCAASGGITRLPTGQPLLVCVPGQALAITTSGGNTYLDAHYIEVPINVDIL